MTDRNHFIMEPL